MLGAPLLDLESHESHEVETVTQPSGHTPWTRWTPWMEVPQLSTDRWLVDFTDFTAVITRHHHHRVSWVSWVIAYCHSCAAINYRFERKVRDLKDYTVRCVEMHTVLVFFSDWLLFCRAVGTGFVRARHCIAPAEGYMCHGRYVMICQEGNSKPCWMLPGWMVRYVACWFEYSIC